MVEVIWIILTKETNKKEKKNDLNVKVLGLEEELGLYIKFEHLKIYPCKISIVIIMRYNSYILETKISKIFTFWDKYNFLLIWKFNTISNSLIEKKIKIDLCYKRNYKKIK